MTRSLSYLGLASSVVLVIAVLLGGCAAAPTGGRGGSWCEIEEPLRMSEATIIAMTKPELEVAVAHNNFGEAECGWTPARTTR